MSVRRFILLYAKKGIRIKMFRIVCLVIGYMVGCMETAYFVSKAWKTDLRSQGSGNLGTTNALRVLGVKAGAATFAGDILKSVLAFAAGMFLFPEAGALAGMYGSIGAILGHDFPFYLHFRGGKGIAASIGMVLGLSFAISPLLALVSLGIGIVGVAVSHTISAGSLLFAFSIPVAAYFLRFPVEMTALAAALCVLAFWKHRANIGRLLAGNENRFSIRKK